MTTTILGRFPYQVLTPFPDERPSRQSLLLLHREVNANAMAIPSRRGDGLQGHYALVVPPATYLMISGNIPFIPPPNPGAEPIHPLGATQHVISEANRQYLAQMQEFDMYTTTAAYIKNQILKAVPSTFLYELEDEVLSFARVSALDILQHLDLTYGTITPDDLINNLQDMHREWSIDQPIEELFKHILHCQKFAADIDPISEPMAVRALIQTLEKTGAFPDELKAWRKLPDLQMTFAQAKIEFTRANKERLRAITSKSAGYHQTANNASDRAPLPNPTKRQKLNPNPASSKTGTTPNTNTKTLYYCWSHGYGPNAEHTSGTCRTKAPGHRAEATAYNMLGGCNVIHRRKGEKAIYVHPTAAFVKRESENESTPN
jgi:hypothetical protein